MNTETIETVLADAHAYPFDGVGENPSMVEVAETFGVFMEDMTAEVWGPKDPWCWCYRITGPRSHVRACLVEFWGEDDVDNYFA